MIPSSCLISNWKPVFIHIVTMLIISSLNKLYFFVTFSPKQLMTNDSLQLLIAAIASVRAEADPAFTYATGYHLPYAYGAPLTYAAAAAPVVTYAPTPLVYTAAAGCQNEAGAVVPCAHGGVV